MKKAFTLLEILLATGIFMLVVVVAVAVFTTTSGSSSSTEQLRVISQANRFIFESMSREIRLSRGLVYNENEQQKLLVPPFDMVKDGAGNPVGIIVYQTKKQGVDSSGKDTYLITRRIYRYKINSDGSKDFTIRVEKTSSLMTIDQIILAVKDPNRGISSAFVSVSPVNPELSLVPSYLKTDSFSVIHYAAYPNYLATLDTMTVQPFVDLQLTLVNPAVSSSRGSTTNYKITLKTMLIPRNFLSPFEVVQQGVSGG